MFMAISDMSPAESQSFHDAMELYRSGNDAEAVRMVHKLVESVTRPADRVGVGFYELLWLVESKRLSEARERFSKIQSELLELNRAVLDPPDREVVGNLTVMINFVEAKLLVEEGHKASALNILDYLSTEASAILAGSSFEQIRNEAQILRGFLLVDARRYREAQPLLDGANAPPSWLSLVSHYRGRCYYELKDMEKAKSLLLDALEQGTTANWQARSHFLLGCIYYRSSEFLTAKAEFEQCLKLVDSDFVRDYKVFEWLESADRALTTGSVTDAIGPDVGSKHRPN